MLSEENGQTGLELLKKDNDLGNIPFHHNTDPQFPFGFDTDYFFQVFHSQKLSETPTRPWIITRMEGKIIYAEITEIDFTSPNTLKKKFNHNIENNQNKQEKCDEMKKKSVPNFPSDEKLKHFYQSLNLCKSKPAILSIVPPYDEKYKPALLSDNYPKILTELFDPSKIEMNYLDLCKLGENVELKITSQQQLNVEMETRKQAFEI